MTFISGRTAQNVWTKKSRTYDGELLEQTTEGLHVLDGNEQSFKELGKGTVGEKRTERGTAKSSDKAPSMRSQVSGVKINHADGTYTQVTEISKHAYERISERSIGIDDVASAIKNPLEVSKITYDKYNRPSFKVVGEKATVYINPESGKITTTHKTHTETAKKLKK